MNETDHDVTKWHDLEGRNARNVRTRVCKRCKFSTSNAKEFLHHQITAHDEDIEVHACDKCDFVTPSYTEIVGHKRKHRRSSNVSMRKFSSDSETGMIDDSNNNDKSLDHGSAGGVKVEVDPRPAPGVTHNGLALPAASQAALDGSTGGGGAVRVSTASVSLGRHVTNILECAECDLKTSSAKKLFWHLKEEHGADFDVFECDLCDYATRDRQQLASHHQQQHEDEAAAAVANGNGNGVVVPKIEGGSEAVASGGAAQSGGVTDPPPRGGGAEEGGVSLNGGLSKEEFLSQVELTHGQPVFPKRHCSSGAAVSTPPGAFRHNSLLLPSDDALGMNKATAMYNNQHSYAVKVASPVSSGAGGVRGGKSPASATTAAAAAATASRTPGSANAKRPGCAPVREAVDPAKYVTIQEPDGIKYACSKCGNIYKWRKSLNKHWKEKHDGEIPDPRPNFTALNIPRLKAVGGPPASLGGVGVGVGGISVLKNARESNARYVNSRNDLLSGGDVKEGSSPALRHALGKPAIGGGSSGGGGGGGGGERAATSSGMRVLPGGRSSGRTSGGGGGGGGGESLLKFSSPAEHGGPHVMSDNKAGGARGDIYSVSSFPGMAADGKYGKSSASHNSATYTQHGGGTKRKAPDSPMDLTKQMKIANRGSAAGGLDGDTGALDLSRKPGQLGASPVPVSHLKLQKQQQQQQQQQLHSEDHFQPPPQDEPLDFSMKPSAKSAAAAMNNNNNNSINKEGARGGSGGGSGLAFSVERVQPPSLLQCPSCPYVARSKSDYESHVVLHQQHNPHLPHHPRKRQHKCAECQEVFFNNMELNYHFTVEHAAVIQKTMAAAADGMIPRLSGGGGGGDSGQGGGQVSANTQLYKYLTMDSQGDLLPCMVCGTVFQRQGTLADHFEEEHATLLNPYMKKVSHAASDARHAGKGMLRMMAAGGGDDDNDDDDGGDGDDGGEAGLMRRQCPQCAFVAGSGSELARHQLKHSIARQYVCRVCSYTTRWKDQLMNHYRRSHPTASVGTLTAQTIAGLPSATVPASPSPPLPPLPQQQQQQQQAQPPASSLTPPPEGMTTASSSASQMTTPDRHHHPHQHPHPHHPLPTFTSSSGSVSEMTTEDGTTIVIPQAPEDSDRERHNSDSDDSGSSRGGTGKGGGSGSGRRSGGSTNSAEILLPFKCAVCEYRARWPSEITQHMKNHSDEKPYLCPRCSYKSKWKWDVVKHLKRCGGGTVKDVIDTTKHSKQQQVRSLLADVLPVASAPGTGKGSSSCAKMMQFPGGSGGGGGGGSCGRELLSNGPPNVTIVPLGDGDSEDAEENGRSELSSLNLSLHDEAMNEGQSQQQCQQLQQQQQQLMMMSESQYSDDAESYSSEPRMMQSGTSSDDAAGTSTGGASYSGGMLSQGQHFCLHCPFMGNSPAELKRHSRVHSDEKPFICKTCGYCSKWKCDLKKHLRTYNHTSAVPLTYGGHGRKPADWKDEQGKADESPGGENASNSESDTAVDPDPQRADPDDPDATEDIPRLSPPALLKCGKCQYATYKKNMLESHMKIHRRSSSLLGLSASVGVGVGLGTGGGGGGRLKCKQCDFTASDLPSFLQHKLSHSSAQQAGATDLTSGSGDSPAAAVAADSESVESAASSVVGTPQMAPSSSVKHRRKPLRGNRVLSAMTSREVSPEDGEATTGAGVTGRQDGKEYRAPKELPKEDGGAIDFSKKSPPIGTVAPMVQESSQSIQTKLANQAAAASTTATATAAASAPAAGGFHRCPDCPYKTENSVIYEKHIRCHNTTNKYTCEWCNWSIDRLNLLFRHAQIVHADDLALQEKGTFFGKVRVRDSTGSTGFVAGDADLENVGDAAEEPFDDDVVGLTGHSISHRPLKRARESTGEPRSTKRRRRLKTCPKCGYITDNVTTLQRHLAKHGSTGKFSCNYCDYSVDRLHIVDYHMKMVHLNLDGEPKQVPGNNNAADEKLVEKEAERPVDDVEGEDEAADMEGEEDVEEDYGEEDDEDDDDEEEEEEEREDGGCGIIRDGQIVEEELEDAEGGKRRRVIWEITKIKGQRMKVQRVGNKTTYHCLLCPFITKNITNSANHVRQHGAKKKYVCEYCDYSLDQLRHIMAHMKNMHGARNTSLDGDISMETSDECFHMGLEDPESSPLLDAEELAGATGSAAAKDAGEKPAPAEQNTEGEKAAVKEEEEEEETQNDGEEEKENEGVGGVNVTKGRVTRQRDGSLTPKAAAGPTTATAFASAAPAPATPTKDQGSKSNGSPVSPKTGNGHTRYRCTRCPFVTQAPASWKRHLATHQRFGPKLRCDTCRYKATTAKLLRHHVLANHAQKSGKTKK